MGNPTLFTAETTEDGRVLVWTLGNPPDNTVTPAMLDQLSVALDGLATDGGPDLAILTGSGRVFSKGFDVDAIAAEKEGESHLSSLLIWNDVCTRIVESDKPVIAALGGHCLGAGLELALACHFRLCAERVRLALPELARGLIPGLGGVHRLVRLVGRAKALEMIALGDFVTAEEAHRIGLVNRVLPRSDFFDGVLSFARAILSVDQVLVREVIRLTRLTEDKSDQDSVVDTIEVIASL